MALCTLALPARCAPPPRRNTLRCRGRTAANAATGATAPPPPAPPPPAPSAPASFPGPPASYDHRAAAASAGAALAARHPSLAPLIASGLLISLPRPPDYVERRTDGYTAPEHVYLLGTAHLSARSAADVARVAEALSPDAIVVELCRSRAGVMYDTADVAGGTPGGGAGGGADGNALGLMGGESFGASLARSLRLGGGGAPLLLRAALGAAARRAAGGALPPPSPSSAPASARPSLGAEFFAARRAAEALGATLVLGDRPVEITLRRALAAASPAERTRAARAIAPLLLPPALASALSGSSGDAASASRMPLVAPTPEALDALLEDEDAVGALFARFAADFPSLAAPLVHERDAYLAWSLCRSKAVNGKTRVLGVVGAGHLRGVTWAMTHDAGAALRFDALIGRDAATKEAAAAAEAANPLWKRLATDALLWGGAAAAWGALTQPHEL
jgi:hypothetical protein